MGILSTRTAAAGHKTTHIEETSEIAGIELMGWKDEAKRTAILMSRKIPDLDGPWDEEADVVHFSSHGFDCQILRHPYFGHLCGYVGLPRTHPFACDYEGVPDIEVHGGLTFAGERSETKKNLYWLGFDCSHFFDLTPGMDWMLGETHRRIYRTIAYVTAECEKLAAQCVVEAVDVLDLLERTKAKPDDKG